ncbi:hypothetical protein [Amycolatopsis sulphurea]
MRAVQNRLWFAEDLRDTGDLGDDGPAGAYLPALTRWALKS